MTSSSKSSSNIEKPNSLEKLENHEENHNWKSPKDSKPRIMWQWRDLDGAKLTEVTRDDLCFEDWPKTRIRKEACLGMLYSTGYRFIKLNKAPPNGFKCAPMPINLAMAIATKEEIERREKLAREEAKKAAKKQEKENEGKKAA